MYDSYRALYLHIPFCKQRCLYCDFDTDAVDGDDEFITSYAEEMVRSIRAEGRAGHLSDISTIYFGGGTPSYVPRLTTQLLYTLSLSMHLTDEVECTIEANPESLTQRFVQDVWALGANRLSIGVQSFDDEVLATLGRVHDAQMAREALRVAHGRFENVSVDLMCGIPGQSNNSFEQSVREAIEAGVTHVSIYPLAIEPATPFFRMVQRATLPLPDEEVQAEQMKLAAALLHEAGFERYEVASYAKPGFACRHNIAYWTGVPYLGIGRSAVTMTQNAERRMRKKDDAITDDLDAYQMAAEDMMLRMRMTAGIPDDVVEHTTKLLPKLPATLDNLVRKGLVVHDEGAWKPTELGWLYGNELYGALFDLAP